jgi:hypothetical protein
MSERVVTNLRFVLVTTFLILVLSSFTGCFSRRNFTNDPVKWEFVSGDGTWNAKSRKWTVYIGSNDTKTLALELQNTGTEDLMVLVVMGAPDSIGFRLERSSSVLLGGNGVGVLAGKSATITVNAIARINIGSPQRYVFDLSWSTEDPLNKVP